MSTAYEPLPAIAIRARQEAEAAAAGAPAGLQMQPKKHITDTRPYAQFTSYPAPPMQVRKRTMLWWVALGSAILAIIVIALIVLTKLLQPTSTSNVSQPTKCLVGTGFLPKPVGDVATLCTSRTSTCCAPGPTFDNRYNFTSLFMGVTSASACGQLLAELTCAVCYPSAGYFCDAYNITSNASPPPLHPCSNFCERVFAACKGATLACGNPPCPTLAAAYPKFTDAACTAALQVAPPRGLNCFSHGKARAVLDRSLAIVLLAVTSALVLVRGR